MYRQVITIRYYVLRIFQLAYPAVLVKDEQAATRRYLRWREIRLQANIMKAESTRNRVIKLLTACEETAN